MGYDIDDEMQARSEWVAHQSPQCEYIGFLGGELAFFVFNEAEYCFVHGQYLATIVLGLIFIERSLAAMFYAAGRNDLKRTTMEILSKTALEDGWINETDYSNIDQARIIRNSVTHFRVPLGDGTIEMRSVETGAPPYAILEEDARHILETIFRLISKNVLCWTV